MVRLEGGRLSEDLADFLPDYKCAVRQSHVYVPQGHRCTAICSIDQVHRSRAEDLHSQRLQFYIL